MQLLTREKIEERLRVGDQTKIAIDPILDQAQFGEVTFDLRLGTDFLVSLMTRSPSINLAAAPGAPGEERVRGVDSYFRNTRREFGDKFTKIRIDATNSLHSRCAGGGRQVDGGATGH